MRSIAISHTPCDDKHIMDKKLSMEKIPNKKKTVTLLKRNVSCDSSEESKKEETTHQDR